MEATYLVITFILPGLSRRPVGGYKVVYQYANEFATRGNVVNIVHVEQLPSGQSGLRIILKRKAIQFRLMGEKSIDWFKFHKNVNILFAPNFKPKYIPDADVIIATAWFTAFPVASFPNNKGKKLYFIQHYEIQHGYKDLVDDSWRLPIKKIVIASWLKKIGNDLGVETELVKNFVDTNEFFLENNPINRENSISMLYHVEPWKGSADGIKVLKNVLREYPDMDITLFGVNERPKELDKNIKYLKNLSPAELRESVYNKSSIFLFPSHSEGWGLTATEAMACGNALVSTKNGGVEDFGIEGETALLSEVGDIDGLTNGVLNLIRDRPLRNKMQEEAVNMVSKLTIDTSSNEFLSIIKKVL